MRTYENKNIYPELGTKRIKEGFLFVPIKLDGVRRWLEEAKWEEEYCDVSTYYDRGDGRVMKHWLDIEQEEIISNTKVVEWK